MLHCRLLDFSASKPKSGPHILDIPEIGIITTRKRFNGEHFIKGTVWQFREDLYNEQVCISPFHFEFTDSYLKYNQISHSFCLGNFSVFS